MILKWLFLSFFLVHVFANSRQAEVDVLIVGAGVAGLSAAEELVRNGITNIMIIESAKRIGGRIHPIPNNEGFIELGANWIHGNQDDNSIYSFSKDNGLLKDSVKDLTDEMFETGKFYKSNGEKLPSSATYEALYVFGETLEGFEQHPNITSMQDYYDQAIEDYIQVYPSSISKKAIEDFRAAMHALGGVIEVEASDDFGKLPAKLLELSAESIFSDVNFLLKGGMQSIVDALLSNLPEGIIHLNERVLNINMTNSNIEVTTDNRTYTANHVIVTIPLGVLKATHDVIFSPGLPDDKVEAIKNMEFGALNKIFLEWTEPWWTSSDPMLFAWTQEELDTQSMPDEWFKSVPLVIPYNRGTKNLLWFNVVGDGARVADTLDDDEIVKITTELFRNFTGNPDIPPPCKIYRQNWTTDPSFRGTYSHPGFNSQPKDYDILLEPLPSIERPKLLLAGEHTHQKYSASMHGARSSGLEQAMKIVNAKRN